MDAYAAIVTKRDTRAFLDQPVPDDVLRRILQAGRMAGTSKNVQACRFLVLDDPAVRQEIATCGDFAAWLPAVPLAIAVAVSDRDTRAEFDAGRAAQNMMVAAWADGVASCPTTMHRADCARETLGLPADFHVSTVVGFGYRAKPQKRVAEAARLPFDEYVRRNRW
ncbi:MAG TPA: nitroreductase family protein [Dehalococcoidia bacterium]|nr:nitroreductase family protein [Dehalococcoidia bacterium]